MRAFILLLTACLFFLARPSIACFCNCYVFWGNCGDDEVCAYGVLDEEDECFWMTPKPPMDQRAGDGHCKESADAHMGNCDGICRDSDRGSLFSSEDEGLLSHAVLLWGAAFNTTAAMGGGTPDAALVDAARSLPFVNPKTADSIGHFVLVLLVHSRGMGWIDLESARYGLDELTIHDLSRDRSQIEIGELAVEALAAEIVTKRAGEAYLVGAIADRAEMSRWFPAYGADTNPLDRLRVRVRALGEYIGRGQYTTAQPDAGRPVRRVASVSQATYTARTGRVIEGVVIQKRAIEAFCYINSDTSLSFATPLENNGETLIDWGVMGGTASTLCSTLSSIVTRFNFAYATSSQDTSVGGPGAALTMTFYTNYNGLGNDSGNTPIATFAFTGLPGFSGSSSSIGAGYFFTVDLSGGFEIRIPTGSIAIGFSSPETSNNGDGFANTGGLLCFAGDGTGGPEPLTGNLDCIDSWLPDTSGVSGGSFLFGGGADNFTSWYWAVARADLSGSPASVGTRNGGTNPSSYAGSTAVLGGTYTATVNNALAGELLSLLIALDSAFGPFPLGSGQTLLCLDLGGSGELWSGSGIGGIPVGGGLDGYAISIPNNVDLCGFFLCSFALQFGTPPFTLSNSQDLVVGS